MINRIIEYYKVPHPLEENKGNIVISDPGKLSEQCFNIWVDDKKSTGPARFLRMLRVLISPEERPDPEDVDLVKRFEGNAHIQDNQIWGIFKLRIFLRFTVACVVGYGIYWTIFNFSWFWVPATVFLERILGDTITRIFQGVVIALIPGLSFIRNFVGAKRWVRAHLRSRCTRIFSRFGTSSRDYFTREVTRCLRHIEVAAREERVPLEVAPLRDILEEIVTNYQVSLDFARSWSGRFDKILEEFSQRARRETFLEGVVIKLDQLKGDLLLHYLEGFQMVPLKVATVNSSPEEFFPSYGQEWDVNAGILAKGFLEKSRSLRDFLNATSSRRQRIRTSFDSLNNAKGKNERVRLLEDIEEGFESLRNIAGNFHFGDNPSIPYEKGENLNDFFDRLYHLFGEAKLDILQGKGTVKGIVLRYRTIKTEQVQTRRIEELKLKVERLLRQGVTTKKGYERISHLFSFFGSNLKRSLVFSGIIWFIFASLLSFKVLGPDQALTTTYLRWGVKERATQKTPLLSRGVRVYQFGQGIPILPEKQLFWQLPLPLVFSHEIDFSRSRTFSSYMIFAAPTDTFYKKGLKLLAGAYGGYYDVVEISFDFVVKNRETWIRYDYDGKGTERLRRDISFLIDEWRGELFDLRESPLVDLEDEEEMEKIFSGSYFKKLWNDGRMREIIQSQIFRNPMMTYQYGTYADMIAPGLDLVLRNLEREEAEVKYSDFSRKEQEQKLAQIDEFKSWVENTKRETLEMVAEEYDALRKDPEQFKKYLSDPESISELKSFETVWSAVQRIMLQQYTAEKLIRIMKGELGEEMRQEILQMLLKKIQENPYFTSLVEIRDVKARVSFMDSHGYRSFVSKIMKEVI